jgi:hypothetical protein
VAWRILGNYLVPISIDQLLDWIPSDRRLVNLAPPIGPALDPSHSEFNMRRTAVVIAELRSATGADIEILKLFIEATNRAVEFLHGGS